MAVLSAMVLLLGTTPGVAGQGRPCPESPGARGGMYVWHFSPQGRRDSAAERVTEAFERELTTYFQGDTTTRVLERRNFPWLVQRIRSEASLARGGVAASDIDRCLKLIGAEQVVSGVISSGGELGQPPRLRVDVTVTGLNGAFIANAGKDIDSALVAPGNQGRLRGAMHEMLSGMFAPPKEVAWLVEVKPAVVALWQRDKRTLAPTVTGPSGRQVRRNPTWSSSDALVAQVWSDGTVVAGSGEGSAIVTATVDGKVGTANVRVFRRPVAPVSALTAGALLPGLGQILTHRVGFGLVVLGAAGGAAYYGLKPVATTRDSTFIGAFGQSYQQTYTTQDRTHLSRGAAMYATITLVAAVESYYYADRAIRTGPGGFYRIGVLDAAPALRLDGPRTDLGLAIRRAR